MSNSESDRDILIKLSTEIGFIREKIEDLVKNVDGGKTEFSSLKTEFSTLKTDLELVKNEVKENTLMRTKVNNALYTSFLSLLTLLGVLLVFLYNLFIK